MLAAANAAIAKEKQQQLFADRLADEYKQRLIELSKRDHHTISILHSRSWEQQQFKYRKIRREDYDKSRELIEDFEGYDYADESERLEAMLKGYEFLASCYLSMTPEQFKHADWLELKDVINACEYRTHNSIAPASKSLYELFFLGTTRTLTKSERDAFYMYRLWKKWKTKPWEINGGIVYPEDIQTVLRIEEIEMAAEKRQQEKQESLTRLKAAKRG